MAVKWDDALDLSQFELQNAVVQNLGADPSSPVNGQIWYSTAGSHEPRMRVNGATVSLLPSSLLSSANTWTNANTFNGAINGSGTINLTGAGASSVGGTLAATAHGATGLTGATAATRYVGGTASSAPVSGTFLTGDWVVSQNGHIWVCTAGGTPGTWVDASAAAAPAPASTVSAETSYGISSSAGAAVTYSRGDHTHGTPTHLAADHSTIPLSAFAAAATTINLGGFRATNAGDPTSAQDLATKNYVDASVAGLAWKDPVATVYTTNVTGTYANGASGVGATITAGSNGALGTNDGYTVAANDRILLAGQSTAANNGIYVVTQLGDGTHPYILTRATDNDAPADVDQTTVSVDNGTTNGGTVWHLTSTGAITVGTTSLTFSIWTGATASTAGAGLTATGNVFAVGAGTGITVGTDTVSIDTSITARWKTALIGNGAATSIAVAHNLGNQFVVAMAYYASSGDWAPCRISLTDVNTTTFNFGSAPASNAVRVVIVG